MLSPVNLNYVELLVGYLIYVLTPYLPEIMMYFLKRFGICRYILYGDKDNYKKIVRLIEKETHSTSLSYRNGKIQPSGYFYSARCFGVYGQDARYIDDEKITLITTTDYYNSMIKTIESGCDNSPPSKKRTLSEEPLISIEKPATKETIDVFMRSGTYKNFWYKKITKDITHITPFKTQEPVVDDIVMRYKEHERLAVFIHGVSMAGKSTIGYLVAKALKARYTHSFNPSDPGDTFDVMISDIIEYDKNEGENEIDKPLVIVMEEADIMITAIHNQTIKRHTDIPTPVHNKTTWNNFLNDLVFHKKIIVILTSNASKEEIDKMDTSYLNAGRINATYSMMEPLSLNS